MKKYLSLEDIENLEQLIDKALSLKRDPLSLHSLGRDKHLLLLFSNPSLRTRLSTERAAKNLGMQVTTMDLSSGWKLEYEEGNVMDQDKAEHIKEAAQVVSQYADIIGLRSFPSLNDRQKDYEDFQIRQLAQWASKPIINLESAIRHPLQALADLITIRENTSKTRPKVVITWAPHPRALPQAVANSFIQFMQRSQMDLTVTHPEGMDLAPAIIGNSPVIHDQRTAFEGADFIYAKSWSSYSDYGKSKYIKEWMIDQDKMSLTNQGKFMHCLPVRRNVVVSGSVLDSSSSLVIEQANNRTFAAQAVLSEILSHE